MRRRWRSYRAKKAASNVRLLALNAHKEALIALGADVLLGTTDTEPGMYGVPELGTTINGVELGVSVWKHWPPSKRVTFFIIHHARFLYRYQDAISIQDNQIVEATLDDWEII